MRDDERVQGSKQTREVEVFEHGFAVAYSERTSRVKHTSSCRLGICVRDIGWLDLGTV
jgi:hypothetical protein